MAVTKKVQLKLTLTNGKKSIINLPEAINDTLSDPTTHDTIWNLTFAPIVAAYESDDGAGVASISYHVIETVDTEIATDYAGE